MSDKWEVDYQEDPQTGRLYYDVFCNGSSLNLDGDRIRDISTLREFIRELYRQGASLTEGQRDALLEDTEQLPCIITLEKERKAT